MEKVIRVCDEDECRDGDVHATASHEYEIDGHHYRIDLCGPHEIQFLAFKELQDKYVRLGHDSVTESKPPRAPRSRAPRHDNPEAVAIREWAKEAQIEIAERGRIPAEVRERWEREGRRPLQSVPPQMVAVANGSAPD